MSARLSHALCPHLSLARVPLSLLNFSAGTKFTRLARRVSSFSRPAPPRVSFFDGLFRLEPRLKKKKKTFLFLYRCWHLFLSSSVVGPFSTLRGGVSQKILIDCRGDPADWDSCVSPMCCFSPPSSWRPFSSEELDFSILFWIALFPPRFPDGASLFDFFFYYRPWAPFGEDCCFQPSPLPSSDRFVAVFSFLELLFIRSRDELFFFLFALRPPHFFLGSPSFSS